MRGDAECERNQFLGLFVERAVPRDSLRECGKSCIVSGMSLRSLRMFADGGQPAELVRLAMQAGLVDD
jgi:hypothetical protein